MEVRINQKRRRYLIATNLRRLAPNKQPALRASRFHRTEFFCETTPSYIPLAN
jgi:hypothetical protein